MKYHVFLAILFFYSNAISQAPVVENVRFEQRSDGSLLVDIYYDVTDVDDDFVDIIVEASDDSGQHYFYSCWTLTGDVGRGIATGSNKHIVWDFYKDSPETSGDNFRIRVTAFDELCGSVIKKDLTLTEDLVATIAPNVTLDLGGYTIRCDTKKDLTIGVGIMPFDGITIVMSP